MLSDYHWVFVPRHTSSKEQTNSCSPSPHQEPDHSPKIRKDFWENTESVVSSYPDRRSLTLSLLCQHAILKKNRESRRI